MYVCCCLRRSTLRCKLSILNVKASEMCIHMFTVQIFRKKQYKQIMFRRRRRKKSELYQIYSPLYMLIIILALFFFFLSFFFHTTNNGLKIIINKC